MKNKVFAFSFCIGGMFAGLATSCGSRQIAPPAEPVQILKTDGFPTGETGFSKGVSACYAGVSDGCLLMAGGCNFPEEPAAEGGEKRFYQGIYVSALSDDSLLSWRKAGELPAPSAYGVSIATPQGVVCVGGTNAQGAMKSVYRISLQADRQDATVEVLPSLPCTLDNSGGALVGNVIYVAGGNADGRPSNLVYCLNLAEPEVGWQRLPDFPGEPRTQPVCAGQQKNGEFQFFLWGGFAASSDGRPASLSVDGYCYSPSTGQWTSVATPLRSDGQPISLGGGAATAWTDSLILCMGGVNQDVFLKALQREERLKRATADGNAPEVDSLKAEGKRYLLESPSFYRFNDRISVYNTRKDTWEELIRTPETARAGAALVGGGNRFFSIGGELKPGIRTPEITAIILRPCKSE